MSDQYAHVVKSSLKLKTVGTDAGIKKKKKQKQTDADTVAKMLDGMTDMQTRKREGPPVAAATSSKTKAELAFHEMQEKRQMERIMKKAEKTHKQQVEDFNKHLDSLSEHYDIPKVSWTK